ncbi:MAG TPA: hypothetical protein VHU23_13255 [Rhizomicrobium sp.]|jgi:hypothetical protein|nr:hypothetical protein [Rhizomicrobium sp.]
MSARVELEVLLCEQIRRRIPDPAPGEADVLACLCEMASFVPQFARCDLTPKIGERLESLALSLDRGISLIGASRLKGTAVEWYYQQATQSAVTAALAFEEPAGFA